MLLEAPAGLGKTSLVEAAGLHASSLGFEVLSARGSDLERDFSFGTVRQLLETIANRPESGAFFAGAAGLAAPLLRHTAPAIGAIPGPDASFPVLHGLYWLVANIAEKQPVILTVDDCHWVDEATLRFLAYLAPRMDGMRALLLVATRPRPDDTTHDDVLSRIAMTPGTVNLSPRPLTRAGCHAVVQARAGRPPTARFVDACHHATAGNPLYLAMLLRQMGTADNLGEPAQLEQIARMGPEPVAKSVMLTVGWLHPAAASCVRALAVLGDDARVDTMAVLAEVDDTSANDAVEALRRADLVTVDTAPAFSHPVVREAVYEDMARVERRRLHGVAAELLHAAGAQPERVAAHLLHADPPESAWAIEILMTAAGAALMRGDAGPAIRFLERAVAVAPEPEALHLLGLARLLEGRPDAIDALRRSVDATTDWAARTPRVEHLAEALQYGSDFEAAEALLHDHLEKAPESIPADLRMRLEAQRLATKVYGDRAALEAVLARMSDDMLADSPGARALLTTVAFSMTMRREPDDEILAALRAASDSILRERVGPGSWANLLYVLIARESPEAAAVIERALVQSRVSGSRFDYAMAIHFRARLAHWCGDLRAAEADARAALEVVGEAFPIGRTPSTTILVDALVESGKIAEARGVVDAHAAAGGELMPWMRLAMDHSTARLLLAEGRAADAVAVIERFRRGVEQFGPGGGAQFTPWRQTGVAARLAVGDLREARALAEQEHAIAAVAGVPTAMGASLRLLATTFPSPDVRAVEKLEESADVLRATGARLELARTLYELGRAHGRCGQRAPARERHQEALDLAEECGAEPLAVRARVELAALGVQPRRRPSAAVDLLTAGERHVCELAATGLSNPEIAQALFVTRKTVETHLGHAYRKLGIAGRGQLPDVLRS